MKIAFAAVCGTILFFGTNAVAEPPEALDPTSQVSYSLGYQIGQDMLRQGTQIQPDVMRRGILDGLAGTAPLLDSKEMQQILSTLKNKVLADHRNNKRKSPESYHEEDRRFLEENAKREGVVSLSDGLQYEVLRQGTGKFPGPSDQVTVHYSSTRINGQSFASTYRKGKPETYRVSKLIPGLSEALQLMKEGAKWRIFIPAELAFGRRTPLEGRAVIYELELIAVEEGT